MNDVRNALRQLTRSPGFSLIVVLILAVGIGATTAIFSSFHSILVRPLPTPTADQLVNLSAPGRHLGGVTTSDAGDQDFVFSYPMFRDLEARQTSFAGIAAHSIFQANITDEGRTVAGTGMLVSGSYFDVLGLRPALGRLIEVEDEPQVGESAVAVLSYDHWMNALGGDPGVIGKTLKINGRTLAIIGVAPRGFSGTTLGTRAQVFVPLTLRWLMQPSASRSEDNRFSYWLYMFARLKPDVTIEQATASINTLHSAILTEVERPLLSRVPDEVREPYLGRKIVLEPGALGQSIVRKYADLPLILLLGLSTCVLLIVCVNIANLLLARGVSRIAEMAVRKSLGATNSLLLRQLLVEAGTLAALGGILSIPVASMILAVIRSISPAKLADSLSVDAEFATLFIIGVASTTSLLFGLLPAVQATRTSPGKIMTATASRSIGTRHIGRVRSILAASQVAFSLVLIVFAGLFAQSLRNVARVDIGIDMDVVAFDVAPRLNGYDSDRVMQLADRIEEAISAQPGVASVASSWVRPLIDDFARGPVAIEGVENEAGADSTSWFNAISPGYFRTLSINVLAGREFTEADTFDSPRVAIVNESFAHRFDLGADVIGSRFRGANDQDYEVVGLVEDAKYSDVKGDIPPQYFLPRYQYPDFETMTFYVRGSIEPSAIMSMIPPVMSEVDSSLPVYKLSTMRRVAENNVYLDRLVSLLSGGFAVLALLLAGIGLYSVLAYNVTNRIREFGLRQALGAKPGDLRMIVFRQVAVVAGAGIAVGLCVALALGKITESLLFGLTGHEPGILVAAVIVLSAFVAISAWIPARRAGRIAPMRALREQ